MNCSEWLIAISVIEIVLHYVLANETVLSSPGPRIVGGHAVQIHQVPFSLALHSKSYGFLCGAVILSARWAMSALHCVEPTMLARNYYVRAGSSMNDMGGSVHRVGKFYSLGWKYFEGQAIPLHDIVLFTVKNRFRFSNRVRPAKLPLDGIEAPRLLRVSGWGSTNTSIEAGTRQQAFPSVPIYLRAANVTKVTWQDCVTRNPLYESIVSRQRHLCYGESEADACYGDSGGPLADYQTVYGIVSFGDGCGVSPGVYVKVSYYRRWIKRITKL